MAKKKQDLTPEERLAAALVPKEEWPYALPDGWKWVRLLGGAATCMDNKRKPVNSKERANRIGEIPYYGATGQVGWIDEYLTNEELILLGEDGAPFLDILKTKAYIINGKSWVNNHAHILKSFMGHIGNLYLMYYLNNFDYRKYVSGTTRLKLTQGKMKNIPVPYPPLSEQRRLVARIESLFAKLDAAKEKVQSVLDSHETRKAALLHAAFAGKLTAKWQEEQSAKISSWKTMSFEDCIEKMQNGLSKRRGDSGEYVNVLRLTNIAPESLSFQDMRKILLTPDEKKKYKLAPEDVLMVRVNGSKDNVGKQLYIDKKDAEHHLTFCDHLIRIHYNEQLVSPRFMVYFSHTMQYKSYIEKNMVSSAGQNTISRKGMKNLSLRLPSLPEQQEIVRILGRLLAREQRARQAAEETLAAINRMKQSILARAFRGEL